ncbi:hypothetical protein PoHVEF18_005846 [Penicillium ochrochloron]
MSSKAEPHLTDGGPVSPSEHAANRSSRGADETHLATDYWEEPSVEAGFRISELYTEQMEYAKRHAQFILVVTHLHVIMPPELAAKMKTLLVAAWALVPQPRVWRLLADAQRHGSCSAGPGEESKKGSDKANEDTDDGWVKNIRESLEEPREEVGVKAGEDDWETV